MQRQASPKKCGAICAKGKKCKNSPVFGGERCRLHQSPFSSSPKKASPEGSKAVVTKQKRSPQKKTSPFSTPPFRKSPSPPQQGFGFIDTPFGSVSTAPDPYAASLFSGTKWGTPESLGIEDSDLSLYEALVKLSKGKSREFLRIPIIVQKFKEVHKVMEDMAKTNKQLRQIHELWIAMWGSNLSVWELGLPKTGEVCAVCGLTRTLKFKYVYIGRNDEDVTVYAGPDCNRVISAMRSLAWYCKDAAASLQFIKPGDKNFFPRMDRISDEIQNYVDDVVEARRKMKRKYEGRKSRK